MYSYAQMNGQHQEVGPPQQTSQASCHGPSDSTRAWSANDTLQYVAVNPGLRPSQNAIFFSQSGGYPNRQMENWQRSEGSLPNSQENTTTTNFKEYLTGTLPSHLPNSSANSQIESSFQLATCGSQTSRLQNFHQYSPIQNLPKETMSNNKYPQQNMSMYWKQPVTANVTQTVKAQDVSYKQQRKFPQKLFGILTESMYTAAAPSLPQKPVVNSSSLVSATTHNVQTSQIAPNQIFKQSYAKNGYSSVYPPNLGRGTSQSFGNSSLATQSFSNGQVVCVSNTSQKTQQQTAQHSFSQNCWIDPTNSRRTSLMNQSSTNSSLEKTSELPSNPAGAPPDMLKCQATACTDYSSPPSYDSHDFTITSRMYNQNVQHGTSACSESYNLNATQPLSLHSAQYVPQSVTSKGNLFLNTLPQPLPTTFSVDTARRGREKAVTVSLPNNNTVLKARSVSSLTDRPHLLQALESMSKQKHKLEFFKKHPTLIQLLVQISAANQHDSSNHPVPGHTGPKAVAVVSPLSQEDEHFSANTATCKSLNITEKECVTPDVVKNRDIACLEKNSDLNQENPNSANQAASNGFLTSSDCENQSSCQICEEDNTEPVAQKTPEAPLSQTATPFSLPVIDLSSLESNTWTMGALNKLILEMENAQPKPRDDQSHSTTVKILIAMWDKNIKKLLKNYRALYETDILSRVEQICTHITQDSVVLSQLKPDFKDHLKHYVLEDGKFYSEEPYKSSWLNVNDQLDDIDKEFGFPWTLKQHLYVHETCSQINTANSITEPITNGALSEPDPESVDLIEEKDTSTLEIPPTTLPSPDELDTSSEASYSFKLEVLPPEEAKAIYDQVQKQTHKVTGCEDVILLSSSTRSETSKYMDVTSKSEVKYKSDEQIKEICCLARFMEIHSLSGSTLFQCLCGKDQSTNGHTVQMLKPDHENPAKSKDIDCQVITLGAPDLSCEVDQTLDFNQPPPEKEPETISQISTGNLLDIVSMNDSQNKSLATTDLVIPKEIEKLAFEKTTSDDKSLQEERKSTETIPTGSSISSAKQAGDGQICHTGTEIIVPVLDQEENCEQTNIKPAEEAASSLETKGKSQITSQADLSHHDRVNKFKEKRKRHTSPNQFFPGLKPQKKCKLPTDLESDQPSSSKLKTVELVLFGSGQQKRGSLSGHKRGCNLFSGFYMKDNPPEVLSVKLDSSKRKSTEADHPSSYSVKQLIYERWRESVPTPNCSIISWLKKKERGPKHRTASLSSTNKVLQSVSSETKVCDRKSKHILSLKKRRSLSYSRKLEEGKKRSCSVMVVQPADVEERRTQNKNLDVMPLQENIILKFSVLPNTFSFKDEPRVNETSESISDYPKPPEKDQRLERKVVNLKGLWCPAPVNQQQATQVPRNVDLFHEYQKKYKTIRKSIEELSEK